MTRSSLVLLLALALVAGSVGLWLLWPHAAPPHLAADLWKQYKTKFVTADGRVIDLQDHEEITHTEGQGYALLLAEAAGDQETFQRLWDWTRGHLARADGLFSWRWQDGKVTDSNNASDGDVLIAWALLRAGREWHRAEYVDRAQEIAATLLDRQTVRRGHLTLLLPGMEGFEDADGVVINLSYWVFPAFRDFAVAFHQPAWADLVESGEELLRQARFGRWQLPPDWLRVDASGVAPAPNFPPRYGFNAVRIPLHLAWLDDPRAAGLQTPFLAFWQSHQGNRVPAWIDVTTGAEADFPWQVGMASIAGLVRDKGAVLPLPGAEDGYFSWSLALLCQVAQKE